MEIEERAIGSFSFSPDGAPIVLPGRGKKVDWPMENGAALPVPRLDWISDKEEELIFIPYG